MYEFKNKERTLALKNNNLLLKTMSMFEYVGLPETMNRIALEKQLQTNGYTFVMEVGGELYSFEGHLTGELDVYGEFTEININNQYLNINERFPLTEGVLIRNDDMMTGLIPIFDYMNTLIMENELTLSIQILLSRIPTILTSGDDSTTESARMFLESIKQGEYGIIGENRFLDGLQSDSTFHVGGIDFTKSIELNQFLKASLYHEVGLNSNYNMKRERLNTSEVEMNEDVLIPLVDNMYRNRVKGIEELNERYSLDVDVMYSSVWSKYNVHDEEDEEVEEVEEIEVEQVEQEEVEVVEDEEDEEGEEDEKDNVQ